MDTPVSDRPDPHETLRMLLEGQRVNNDTMNHLGEALAALLQAQASATERTQRNTVSSGPKVKEPRSYDGDRSNNKLEDHIRDLTNWVTFYDRRGHWISEQEKIEQSATYLTGRMHRMYELQHNIIHTFDGYIAWLNATFRDSNEQQRLRDEWNASIQSDRSVMEYAAEILYLRARIVPTKTDAEIRDHFRTGLKDSIQIRLLEHPDVDTLSFEEFVGRADRYQQIETAQSLVRRRVDGPSSSRVNALVGAPRRGGRRPSSLTRRPRKGTQEWQDWCKANQACYGCGSTNHRSRDCSDKSRPSRSPARGRAQSPYPRSRSQSRESRGRTPSPAPSFSRNPSSKSVAFDEGKDPA